MTDRIKKYIQSPKTVVKKGKIKVAAEGGVSQPQSFTINQKEIKNKRGVLLS